MKIIEYTEQYSEDVKDLLVELEEYILAIDEDELDCLHPDYREKMFELDMEDIKENKGKCFIAVENEKAIGVIMGTIPNYKKYDYLDYKCPKRGVVTELIVSQKARKQKIGQQLLKTMETYFKSQNCEYVLIDVFAYNENAIRFYGKNNYHPRMYTNIKKI